MNNTLLSKHSQKIKEFEGQYKKKDTLKKKITNLQKQISKLEKIPKTKRTDNDFNTLFNKQRQLTDLNKQLSDIEQQKDKKEYFIKTSKILHKYYDTVENPHQEQRTLQEFKNSKNIFGLLHQTFKDDEETDDEDKEKEDDGKTSKHDIRQDLFQKYNNMSRGQLLQEYKMIINKNIYKQHKPQINEKCPKCNIEYNLNTSDSTLICKKCGQSTRAYIDCDKPSYKDAPHEMSYYPYKRINHFNEILAQFQGKENTNIPDWVFVALKRELNKERITDFTKLRESQIRNCLKKLGIANYYEHTNYIINKLSGRPPILTPELETRMREMFKLIQSPYSECPLTQKRKNFINYYYVIYKFFELLGIKEFENRFDLLKGKERLYEHDEIWKFICDKLNWPFYPS